MTAMSRKMQPVCRMEGQGVRDQAAAAVHQHLSQASLISQSAAGHVALPSIQQCGRALIAALVDFLECVSWGWEPMGAPQNWSAPVHGNVATGKCYGECTACMLRPADSMQAHALRLWCLEVRRCLR